MNFSRYMQWSKVKLINNRGKNYVSNKKVQSEYVKNCLSTLELLASEKLKKFEDDGFAESGCNGPYADHDTPLRNTAHWCVTLVILYKWKNDSSYLKTVKIF